MLSTKEERIYFLIGVTLIILFIAIFFIVTIVIFYLSPKERTETQFIVYQFTEIHPFRNTSSIGFVTIPQSLKNNEDYIAYINEETGSTEIITKVGGSEYECSGSCFCGTSNHESRRNIAGTSTVLTRGLMILLTAFSTSMALRLAEETFHNTCVQKFSDSCDSPYIVSILDGCDEPISDQDFDENVKEAAPRPFDPDQRYFCIGTCISVLESEPVGTQVLLRGFPPDQFTQMGLSYIGKCESLKLELKFEMNIPDNPDTKFLKDLGNPMLLVAQASIEFAQGPLSQFCQSSSMLKTEWFPNEEQHRTRTVVQHLVESHPNLKPMADEFLKQRPFCVGIKLHTDPKEGNRVTPADIDNVKCVKIYKDR